MIRCHRTACHPAKVKPFVGFVVVPCKQLHTEHGAIQLLENLQSTTSGGSAAMPEVVALPDSINTPPLTASQHGLEERVLQSGLGIWSSI